MTADHIDRAAEVLIEHTRTSIEGCHCGWSVLGASHAEHVAQALDAAGLLVTHGHEAAVAAKALREAEGDYSHLYRASGPAATAVAAVTCTALRDRADWIEREAGESDADA